LAKREREHHPERVLDGEETQLRHSHGGAEVVERRAGDRAQHEIQQQPEQELHVEQDREPLAAGVVAVAAAS
jgi:hypothetical protein